MAATRRLAAVMFTDIVGSTALTQRDENGALRLIREQEELFRPLFARYHGREVKSTGDGFLVEFNSAREATQCAVEIQQQIHDRNSQRGVTLLQVRIGIHLGDVEQRGSDIFGDAVNIASRIESLAEPGGVCLSTQVFDQIHNKVPYKLEKLEARSLKGIEVPVNVHRVVLPWEQSTPARPATGRPTTNRLAVLPFKNISPNPEDEFFADGLTEEITAEVSELPGLLVIARTSVERYRNDPKPIEEVGRVLRVGTVLEGSVRKAGNKIRITAQLIDAETEVHIWAGSFNREFEDVFAIQTDIAKGVAEALKLRLLSSDGVQGEEPPGSNLEAYALYLRGRVALNRAVSDAETTLALGLFREALGKDPQYSAAYSGIADCFHWLEHRGSVADAVGQSKEAAAMAIRLDPRSPSPHSTLARVLAFHEDDQWDAAERECLTALQLNPSSVESHATYGLVLRHTGRLKEAMDQARQALELDPVGAARNAQVGEEYLIQGRYDEAISYLKNALEIDPDLRWTRQALGIAYVRKGLLDDGIAELQKARSTVADDPESLVNLAWAYAKAGRRDETAKIATEVLGQTEHRRDIMASAAGIYAISGDIEKAVEWLEKARQTRRGSSANFLGSVWFDGMRQDPRFKRVIGSTGFTLLGFDF